MDRGQLAGTGAHSYSAGNATRGSEEAAKFKAAAAKKSAARKPAEEEVEAEGPEEEVIDRRRASGRH